MYGMKRVGNKRMKGKNRMSFSRKISSDHVGWLFSSFSASFLQWRSESICFEKTDKSGHMGRLFSWVPLIQLIDDNGNSLVQLISVLAKL